MADEEKKHAEQLREELFNSRLQEAISPEDGSYFYQDKAHKSRKKLFDYLFRLKKEAKKSESKGDESNDQHKSK